MPRFVPVAGDPFPASCQVVDVCERGRYYIRTARAVGGDMIDGVLDPLEVKLASGK